MEFLQNMTAILPMALLVPAFTAIFSLKLRNSAARDGRFPPGPPGSWPLIGHLPLLGTGCPHHVLAHLARSIGPIIGLRLGSKRAVVVCNSHFAEEVLHTHDKLLANRPHLLVTDYVFYGYDSSIVLSSYNPRWAILRKICTLELFTANRLQALQHVRYEEVRNLLQSLVQESRNGTQAVDLGEAFVVMNANSLSRVFHSKTLAEVGGHAFPSMLKEQEKLFAPSIGDLLPWLKLLDLPRKRAMRNYHKRVDKIIETMVSIQTMVSQRRQLMKTSNDDDLPKDLLQEVLSAGIITTALTLEWAMAELFRNPRCLKKLQHEIDDIMAKEGDHFITDGDISKLPYLEKVVKEAFRLHPAAPLLLPRLASEAVKMDKYTLPAGALLLVNVWAIGRDPNAWENAEEFLPERFDGKDMDVKGRHYDLLPFGSGRRVCPGLRLALSVLHVTLVNLVRTFEWELPNGQTHMDIDMSEQRGIGSIRTMPLLAIPKPRQLTP